jgi:DNA polymerase III subunit delta
VHDAITKELIEDLVEPTPQFTVFELLDAVMARNPKRAREVLFNLQAGEDPYKLFGLLANQVHILAMLVAGKGKTPQEVASDAGAHPFVVRKLSGVSSHTTWPEVKTIIQHLVKLDEQLKSTGADPWLLLETSLMKITSR